MSNAATDKRLVSTTELAAIWGVSYWRIRDLVKEGKLSPLIGLGKGWKWRVSDMEAVLKRL